VRARCTSSEQLREIREAPLERLARQQVGGCLLDVEDELEFRAKAARYQSTTTTRRARGALPWRRLRGVISA
jgi:hypothetical protein